MKKILKLFIFMFIMFVGVLNVKAETLPDKIVIDTNGDYYQTTLYGSKYLPTQGFTSTLTSIRKKDTNNNILYCAQEVEKMPSKNSGEHTWNYKKIADNTNELSFIWENGYRGQTNYGATDYLTGDADADYFLTGMAVWKYTQPASSFDNFEIDSNGNYTGLYAGYSNEVSEKIAKLVNDAKNYKKDPSLKINIDSTKLVLTEDKKYYISSPITFTIKDLTSKVTISLSGMEGAFTTSDKNATGGETSFAQDSTIYIKIPVENMSTSVNLSMRASASGIKYVAYIYEHSSNSNYQMLTKFEEEEISAEDTKTFTTDKIEVVISKRDITNSAEVKGATLVIKKGSTEVLKWVSDGTEKKISLDTGEYTLEETIAPAGYKLNTEKITFKVNSNGTITINGSVVDKVVMKNEPFYVMISKLGLDDSKQLEGATLKITDKEGKLDKDLDGKSLTWITTSNKEKFHLGEGTYYLTEEKAPAGYIKSDKKIEFTISKDGTITINKKEAEEVVMENTPLYIYISKKSINGKTELSGAKLNITNEDGTLDKDLDGKSLTWTSSTKEERFHLAPGKYILTELEAPKGYELSDAVIEFTITEDGKILYNKQEVEDNMIVFKNTPEPEQTQTGSAILYVLFIGIITAGVVTYFVFKRNN